MIAAGWAGWGFDVFDALLFNFVAPNCIPALLHLPPGSRRRTRRRCSGPGSITAVLLLSWAAGGVLFGWARRSHRAQAGTVRHDRPVRTGHRAVRAGQQPAGSSSCVRTLASLGIGGEWGIGAALIAESVPEARRVAAGVIMQTASPLGIVLASAVNYQVAGVWFAGDPQNSWRYVFLAGLAPLVVAARSCASSCARARSWQAAGRARRRRHPRSCSRPHLRRATVSGVFVAVTAVLTWWACNAFIPLLGGTLAAEHAAGAAPRPRAARMLGASLAGTRLQRLQLRRTARRARRLPLARTAQPPQACSSPTFSSPPPPSPPPSAWNWHPQPRLQLLFLVGAGVYGVFGALTFYLPELFPARLRATGAGFCYNIGRVFAAAGPLVVGAISAAAGGSSALAHRHSRSGWRSCRCRPRSSARC